jgi:inhibitor of KinA sporulation pathway (predicted exonuclease)
MRYIVVDVEATCCEDRSAPPRNEMEIIEIGVVRLDELGSFVRPVVHSRLSDFCMELTTIGQHDIDNAGPFAVVLEQFLSWISDGPDLSRVLPVCRYLVLAATACAIATQRWARSTALLATP